MQGGFRAIAGCVALMAAVPGYAGAVSDNLMATLGARLFPVVTSIRDGGRDKAVAAMLAARRHRIDACATEAPCLIEAAAWTAGERDILTGAAEHLLAGVNGGPVLPDDGARAEVARELDGLNNILKVYGLGAATRYPAIDGPDQETGQPQQTANVANAIALSVAGRGDPVTALDPSIGLALALLDANDRDQAVAFEPLDMRFNGAALARARSLEWSRYRFTAIVVPGIGPEDLTTPLSAKGKLNVRMAAARYAEGVAPYIILSGGAVHPRGTHYAEALEMRRALIERFHVPEEAIVVEPYARHTTTNLRNATRRLIALGAPLDREALIITNADQSRYIESPKFADRNQHELGYQPGRIGQRLSPTELGFTPSPSSSRVDPMDPLDP